AAGARCRAVPALPGADADSRHEATAALGAVLLPGMERRPTGTACRALVSRSPGAYLAGRLSVMTRAIELRIAPCLQCRPMTGLPSPPSFTSLPFTSVAPIQELV